MIRITSIQDVERHETLKMLYDSSALTIEGLALESIEELANWIDQHGGIKDNPEFFVIDGKTMNDEYGTDYPDDLNVVCLPLDYVKSIPMLAIPRFSIGGRWFDDIVDNAQHRNEEEEYDEEEEYE